MAAAVPARRGRRLSLPAQVSDSLDLVAGERALAWALGPQETWHVGTDRALHIGAVPGANGSGTTFRRVAWERIERADWRSDTAQLVISEVADWGEPEVRTDLTIVERGHLLELLRERVTKSVVINLYAPVRGRRGLNVVGRRTPSGEGDVTWSYVLATGLDPGDPVVRAVAERTLAQAKAELAGL